MEQENVTARLEALEQTTKEHERRIAALEARLDPKTRQQAVTAALDALLDELAGLDQ